MGWFSSRNDKLMKEAKEIEIEEWHKGVRYLESSFGQAVKRIREFEVLVSDKKRGTATIFEKANSHEKTESIRLKERVNVFNMEIFTKPLSDLSTDVINLSDQLAHDLLIQSRKFPKDSANAHRKWLRKEFAHLINEFRRFKHDWSHFRKLVLKNERTNNIGYWVRTLQDDARSLPTAFKSHAIKRLTDDIRGAERLWEQTG